MVSSTTSIDNYDLTTESGVKAYLDETPFASHTIITLSGGSANYTYRIRLVTPHEGRSTLVLKHAEPLIKGSTIPFSLERQKFEFEAMTRVKAWLSPDSVVTIPKIYRFDEDSHVLILEDCGEDTLTLKEFAREGKVTMDLAGEIGTAIGQFIGSMHVWSLKNPGGILDIFRRHQQAMALSAWATYGRLMPTLNGEDVLAALSDPPINVSERDIEVVAKLASDMNIAMTSAHEFFVMGDFWPGNIMVVLDSRGNLERLFVLDWELAKIGLPGVELGQFCAEIHLLRRCVPGVKNSASRILSTFLEAYSCAGNPDVSISRDALVHWGAHLVVWTPRVPWGNKDTTRKIVEEGVRILVGASSPDEDWLRASDLRALLPKH